MAKGKRYYWLKLKTEFLFSDEVRYILEQKNGGNFLVIYLQLCGISINFSGKILKKIGEIFEVFSENNSKKFLDFPKKQVKEALDIFLKLGLIYVDNDGVYCISNFDEMVGSETDYAPKKRGQRVDKGVDNVPIENKSIRDKENKSIDIYTTSSTKAEEAVYNMPTTSADEKLVVKTYEAEIGQASPLVLEVLDGFELSTELKIHAIKEAAKQNKRSLKYIEAILKRYEAEGVKVVADASRGSPRKGDKAEKESNYDFDEIERLEMQRRLERGVGN